MPFNVHMFEVFHNFPEADTITAATHSKLGMLLGDHLRQKGTLLPHYLANKSFLRGSNRNTTKRDRKNLEY